jgi:hypothetical protein
MKEKEVVKKEMNEVSAVVANFGNEELDGSDIVIPKIQLIQKMSSAFEEKLAEEGDFFDSLERKVLGKTFEAQVFNMGKVFRFFEDAEKKKYVKTEPVTKENNDGDYTCKSLVYQLSVLVGDTVGQRSPYGISLAKTSAATGKRLATLFAKKGGTAGVLITFSSTKEKNDEGAWVKWDFSVARDATREEIAEAYQWYQSMKQGRVRHTEEEEESTPAPSPTTLEDDLVF